MPKKLDGPVGELLVWVSVCCRLGEEASGTSPERPRTDLSSGILVLSSVIAAISPDLVAMAGRGFHNLLQAFWFCNYTEREKLFQVGRSLVK